MASCGSQKMGLCADAFVDVRRYPRLLHGQAAVSGRTASARRRHAQAKAKDQDPPPARKKTTPTAESGRPASGPRRRQIVLESDSESDEPSAPASSTPVAVTHTTPNSSSSSSGSKPIPKAPEPSKQVDPSTFFTSSRVTQSDKTMAKRITKPKPSVSQPIDLDDMDDDIDMADIEQIEKSVSVMEGCGESTKGGSKINKDDPTTPQRKRKMPDDVQTTGSASGSHNHHTSPTPKKSTSSSTTPKSKSSAKSPANSPSKRKPTDVQKEAFKKYISRQASGPKAPGTKPIPTGAPDCLLGLSFVFTGDLESTSRQDALDLVKRYGGRVVGAPSSKTSYVVVGDDPGPSKIEKVKTLGLKTLDEDGLFELISSSLSKQPVSQGTTTTSKMSRSDTASSKSGSDVVEPVVKKIKTTTHESKPPPPPSRSTVTPRPNDTTNQLWPDKYKPQSYDEIIGNQSLVKQLATWLNAWSTSSPPTEHAVLISGPPGIGKTTTAHLVARTEGYEIIELNASDTRSKSALESVVKESTGTVSLMAMFGVPPEPMSLSNTSLLTMKGKGKQMHVDPTYYKGKVIIMDEVDGMSSGDRGGMSELIQIIKHTRVPIICICNDRSSPKIRSLANHCLDMRFRRPTAQMIESRLMQICSREGLTMKPNTIAQLCDSTSNDIRHILNILSTYRLTSTSMSYDDSKLVSRSIDKNVTVSVFDVTAKLFGATSFRDMTVPDKLEMYFHDYSMIPLMVHENYLQMTPSLTRDKGLTGKRGLVDTVTLMSEAADSISMGDLIERVQGRENNWGLLPSHGIMSTIIPCFFTHGQMHGRINFAGWLGHNSKSLKSNRVLRDLALHMRVMTSGTKSEIRQQYLPVMSKVMMDPMHREGVDGIPDTIRFMDTYYMTRDDVECMTDLGFGMMNEFPTQVKSAFTRAYNKMVHPCVVVTSGSGGVGKSVSKRNGDGLGGGGVPDSEEILGEMDDDDGVGGGDADDDEDDDDDVSKFAKKSAGASKRGSKSGSSGRGGSSNRGSTGRGRGRGGSTGRGRKPK